MIRATGFSPDLGRIVLVYTNIEQQVTSMGAGINLRYKLPKGLSIGGSYDYAEFDADSALSLAASENTLFFPGFNTPQHRANVFLTGEDIFDTQFGFDLRVRWSDDYIWESPFGVSAIDGYTLVDLGLFYQFPKLHSVIKAAQTT